MSDVVLAALAAMVVCFIANAIIYRDAVEKRELNDKSWNFEMVWAYSPFIIGAYLMPGALSTLLLILYPVAVMAWDIRAREEGWKIERDYMKNWFETEVEPELAKKSDISTDGLDAKIEELLKPNKR